MKIVFCSDLHLDATTAGVDRYVDIAQSFNSVITRACEWADLFICNGDVMDPDCGSKAFRAIDTLLQGACALSHRGIPQLWLPGNHDVIEDGSGLSTMHPIQGAGFKSCVVFTEPTVYEIQELPFRVLALPFTPLTNTYDPSAVIEEISEETGQIDLVIGHLNVKGAQYGDEEDMPRGRDVWLPVETIRKCFKQVPIVNGHIHKKQVTPDGVIIPGSLERLRFDETRNQPGWLELEITPSVANGESQKANGRKSSGDDNFRYIA